MMEYDDKYESILKTSFKVFTESGIRGVSMDDICRHMNISKKTLYKYVENKTDLIQKVCDYIHLQVADAIQQLDKTNLNAIDVLLEMSKFPGKLLNQINPIINFEMRKFYPQIFDNSHRRRKELIIKAVKENVDKGIAEGLYRIDLNKDIIAQLYFKKIEDFHDMDIESMKKYTVDQVFEVMFENHIRGIANEKGIEYFEKQKAKLNFNI